jgi:hypothetical protein
MFEWIGSSASGFSMRQGHLSEEIAAQRKAQRIRRLRQNRNLSLHVPERRKHRQPLHSINFRKEFQIPRFYWDLQAGKERSPQVIHIGNLKHLARCRQKGHFANFTEFVPRKLWRFAVNNLPTITSNCRKDSQQSDFEYIKNQSPA